MGKCSWLGCGNKAIVRIAWYDDIDEVPSFVDGEIAYCSEHYREYGKTPV